MGFSRLPACSPYPYHGVLYLSTVLVTGFCKVVVARHSTYLTVVRLRATRDRNTTAPTRTVYLCPTSPRLTFELRPLYFRRAINGAKLYCVPEDDAMRASLPMLRTLDISNRRRSRNLGRLRWHRLWTCLSLTAESGFRSQR